MSALCGCFGGQKHKSSNTAPKDNRGRSSWSSNPQPPHLEAEQQNTAKRRPKPAPKPQPKYILRQNTLSQYLDVLFFTPETGGEDIVDEATYLPDVTKNLVLIIPWLTPQDDVLMEYCMLYLNYSTDVMVVRYGIHDLLNMPRMREMSTELGGLLRKFCPSYSAVICHSIQGGTFIMCDLLSRNLLVNISGIIVERLACDWINLPLDGLIKHSTSSVVKRLSFRQEHELSVDLKEALMYPEDDDNEFDNFDDIYGVSSRKSTDENPYFENYAKTIPKQLSYSANNPDPRTNTSQIPSGNYTSENIQRRGNNYTANITHSKSYHTSTNPYSLNSNHAQSNNAQTSNHYSANHNLNRHYSTNYTPQSANHYSANQPSFNHASANHPSANHHSVNYNRNNHLSDNHYATNAQAAYGSKSNELSYRHSMAANAQTNSRSRKSIGVDETNSGLNYTKSFQPQRSTQYGYQNGAIPQRTIANGPINNPLLGNNNYVAKSQSFGSCVPNGNSVQKPNGSPSHPSLSIYASRNSAERILDSRGDYGNYGHGEPHNGMYTNYNFNTLNSRYTMNSQNPYGSNYGSNYGSHYGSNYGSNYGNNHQGSNYGTHYGSHYGSQHTSNPGQLFRQHSQSFIEHSTTAMTSFSTIIPHMRVPVLIFATGKDNCDVDGIKAMISNWRFQGVKVTLRYWKKCSGVSLLESHNTAFMKTLDSFLELHNLIVRS